MEDKKKLSRWLLDNYKALELQVTQLKWVEEWIPGFHDFEVSIVMNGQVFKGRGIDRSSDLAFTKAGAEAIERAICEENGISSCGVAVHVDYNLAKVSARNELVERDRFFCHYLTKTAFGKTTPEWSSDWGGIGFLEIQEKLRGHSIAIQVFEMNPLNSIRSMICITQGERMGSTLGMGASENSVISTRKAITECLMNTIATLHEKSLSQKFNGPMNPDSSPPNSHRYIEEENPLWDNKWIFKGNEPLITPEFVEPKRFEYKILERKDALLKKAPIVAVRCLNPYLQDSFFGNFNAKYINLKRLQTFLGQPITLSQLNQSPPPLG